MNEGYVFAAHGSVEPKETVAAKTIAAPRKKSVIPVWTKMFQNDQWKAVRHKQPSI